MCCQQVISPVIEWSSGNAQVVVMNQGETQCIIDYMSMAETTKEIRLEYRT